MVQITTFTTEVKQELISGGKTVVFHLIDSGKWFARKIKDPRGKWGSKSIRSIVNQYAARGESVVVEIL